MSQATVASRHRTRHLHFLSSTRQSVLSYACKLLVRILKGLEPGTSVQDNNGVADMAMGHLLVLLQYGFNRCDVSSSDLLGHILRCIKMREVFNYPIFCHYVISVDFLEEFALLANSGNPVEAGLGHNISYLKIQTSKKINFLNIQKFKKSKLRKAFVKP